MKKIFHVLLWLWSPDTGVSTNAFPLQQRLSAGRGRNTAPADGTLPETLLAGTYCCSVFLGLWSEKWQGCSRARAELVSCLAAVRLGVSIFSFFFSGKYQPSKSSPNAAIQPCPLPPRSHWSRDSNLQCDSKGECSNWWTIESITHEVQWIFNCSYKLEQLKSVKRSPPLEWPVCSDQST